MSRTVIAPSVRSPSSSDSLPVLNVLSRAVCLPLLVFAVLSAGCSSDPETETQVSATGTVDAGEVNVYSARHYDVDDDVYREFTEQTGIKVNLLEGDSAGLLQRLRLEEEASPADVFIAVDAGRLHQAEVDGIFEASSSEVLAERVPESLRHPEGLWYGITKRARVIFYAKDRVDVAALNTYEDLADPVFKDKVLIRSSSNIYNQSLMSSMIAALGEEGAEEWCRGLVANLAREPQGGDRDQLRGIAAGEGDIAVANTYYAAKLAAGSAEDQAVMDKIGVVFPNQDGRGSHVNLSGAGVVAGAANKANAVKFIEFLTGPEAQAAFATANKEYPVVPGYALAPELVAFGEFKEDALNVSEIGGTNQQALMLMDRCGWR